MMNRERYYGGWNFDEMVGAAQKNVELWKSVRARATIDEEALRRVRALGGEWHLLALSEDWCGDSVSTLPFVDALCAATDNVDLRVLGREANPDLMDSHLTDVSSRSIPGVMVLDDQFREHGWWGPRPTLLQHWVLGEGQALEKTELYKEQRRWYARDHGRTTVEEIVALLERAHQTLHGAKASTSAV
jgi:hypothetical protein